MGWPSGFFDKSLIRQHAMELVHQYEKRRGKPVTFPLDPPDLFSTLFDLDTIYDYDGRS